MFFQLLGLAKLPLQQLYLSYRDPKITRTLLKSKVNGRQPTCLIFVSWLLSVLLLLSFLYWRTNLKQFSVLCQGLKFFLFTLFQIRWLFVLASFKKSYKCAPCVVFKYSPCLKNVSTGTKLNLLPLLMNLGAGDIEVGSIVSTSRATGK